MKKTLLALAAIAASSASFAQSSVTLYGVVDASLESVKGEKTVTRVTSGNLATSRLGFKGTEDLGSGMKATFNLEAPVTVDTGAAGSTFWDRQAWVGVGGGFGELRLGRTDSPIGDIAGNVLSAQAYDDLKLLGTRGGDSYRRVSNAVTYLLPTLVFGGGVAAIGPVADTLVALAPLLLATLLLTFATRPWAAGFGEPRPSGGPAA